MSKSYSRSLSFLRARCYIQIHYQLMHIIKNIHSLHFKKLHVKMSVIHIKIKIETPTCFGHSYSTIIRGSQCLCVYCYQCACNISYAYVAVCYLCVCICGVLARMVSARVLFTTVHEPRLVPSQKRICQAIR
jgi:hypothetical protein